ncbi:MAG: hypothetical protein JW778_02700 [Candidatus Altiarchaeota archaeon]|nr:hypothetical protein [Candidatus Altiarchaeota archaeon]
MRRFLLSAVVVLVFMGVCSAQGFGDLMDDLSLQLDFPENKTIEDLHVQVYIVQGSRLSVLERMICDLLMSDASSLQSTAVIVSGENRTIWEIKMSKKTMADNETNLGELMEGSTLVVLVGGRDRNRITDEVYDSGYIVNESTRYMGLLLTGKGRLDNDSSVIVFYQKTTEKLERNAVKNSPLKEFMPEEYVPIAATAIGAILMSASRIIEAVLEFLSMHKGKRKAVFGYTGPRIMGVYLKEVVAIIAAAFILGFSITWTFTGLSWGFFDLFLLNMAVCLFATVAHELSHRVTGKYCGVKIEYRLWYTGSVITILSAFLGSSFGVPGFLLEKMGDCASKCRHALTRLASPMVAIITAMVFYYLHIKDSSTIFQMIYVTASIRAMAEIIPIKGLDGYYVKDWSPAIWSISFIFISLAFFAVNFI